MAVLALCAAGRVVDVRENVIDNWYNKAGRTYFAWVKQSGTRRQDAR
jgi:hypothetical protein